MTVSWDQFAEVQAMLRQADRVTRERLGKSALDCSRDDFAEAGRRADAEMTRLLAERDQAHAEFDGIVGRDLRVAAFGEDWEHFGHGEDDADAG